MYAVHNSNSISTDNTEESCRTSVDDECVGITDETLIELGIGSHLESNGNEDDEEEDSPIIYGQNDEQSESDLEEEPESESDFEQEDRASNNGILTLQYLHKCLLFEPKAIHRVNIDKTIELLEDIASNPYYPYENKVTKLWADLVSDI